MSKSETTRFSMGRPILRTAKWILPLTVLLVISDVGHVAPEKRDDAPPAQDRSAQLGTRPLRTVKVKAVHSSIAAMHRFEIGRAAPRAPTSAPFMPSPPPRLVPGTAMGRKQVTEQTSSMQIESNPPPNPAAPTPIDIFPGMESVLDIFPPKEIPPDTMGAVGPDHLVQLLNNGYLVQDKLTGTFARAEGPDGSCASTADNDPRLYGPNGVCDEAGSGDDIQFPMSLDSFWAGLGAMAADPFDPKILFDQQSGRYFAVTMSNRDSVDSHILLAISSTSDPIDGWDLWAILADDPAAENPFPGTTWADYPGFGLDTDHVYITANMFLLSTATRPGCTISAPFCESKFWIIDKSTAIGGSPAIWEFGPTIGFTWQPTHSFDHVSVTSVNYLISEGWRTSDPCDPLGSGSFPLPMLGIRTVSYPSAVPVITPPLDQDPEFVLVDPYGLEFVDTVTCEVGFSDAEQPDFCDPIETNDHRLLNAVLRNGKIWATHHVDDPILMDGIAKTEVAWYEIDPTQASQTAPIPGPLQQGRVSDPDLWFYFPSITVNFTECVAIGFSGSGPSIVPSAFYTVREPTDPAGTMQSVLLYDPGIHPYVQVDPGDPLDRNRWGDYSATMIDPLDDFTFWTVQERSGVALLTCSDGNWATTWASFGCATTPECFVDLDCNDGLLCNGAETCQAGFCQPGPVPSCDDGQICTADICDPVLDTCVNPPIPDSESAPGADGICNTADDDLNLSGPDGICGTGDDLFGDGFCDAEDNCPDLFNPGQEDEDADGVGNACTETGVCAGHDVIYVASPSNQPFGGVAEVDLATGTPSLVAPQPQVVPWDVASDSAGTFVYLAEQAVSRLSQVEIATSLDILVSNISDVTWVDVVLNAAYVASRTEVYHVDLNAGTFGATTLLASDFVKIAGIDNPSEFSTSIYVTDSDTLKRVDVPIIGPGTVTTVATGLGVLGGVAVKRDESVAYVVGQTAGEILSIDLTPGPTLGVATVLASGLATPVLDIALERNEATAHVSLQGSGEIVSIDLSPGVNFGALTTLSASVDFPTGIGMGPVIFGNGMWVTDTVQGRPGESVVIPVMVSSLSNRNVVSADLTLRYNPMVIQIPLDPAPNGGVSLGPVAGGCTLTTNLTTPGEAIISIFCTTPMSGSGSLVDVTFDILGNRGDGTPILIEGELFNEGSPFICTFDGSISIPHAIDGHLIYYRDEGTSSEPGFEAIGDAQVELVGTGGGFFQSDCVGFYETVPVTLGEALSVVPKKTDVDSAIDPFDAALNAQHVVQLTALSPNQQLAADASGNGALTSFDSSFIAQLSVGSITQLPVAGLNGSSWSFVPVPAPQPNQSITDPIPSAGIQGAISFNPLAQSAVNQDFFGILYGDVSGNWTSSCGLAASAAVASLTESMPTRTTGSLQQGAGQGGGCLILPRINARPGEIIRVPVRTAGTAEAISFYLDLRYDPAVLKVVGVEKGGDAPGFSLAANDQEAGRARIALFNSTALGREGTIAVVTFEVVGVEKAFTRLILHEFTINEGRIGASVVDGSVRVLPGQDARSR